jgi:hypothetical protein
VIDIYVVKKAMPETAGLLLKPWLEMMLIVNLTPLRVYTSGLVDPNLPHTPSQNV